MMRLFKALSAALALGAICGAPFSVHAADASSQATPPKHQIRKTPDIGAHRRDRRYVRADARGDDGYYYDRPVTYRPYPYALPEPFFLGLAFSPYW